MVTGIPYTTVISSFKIDFNQTGITHVDCDEWLTERGYAVSRLFKGHRQPWPPQPWAEVSLVMITLVNGCHWVVLKRDGTVLDPNRTQPTTLTDPCYMSVCQVAGVHKFPACARSPAP